MSKRIDTFKRDTILLEFLKSHKGKANVVSSKEIADYLNNRGYSTKSACVHSLIKKTMYERNAPICYINSRGYFWATSREEIKSTVDDMEKRISALKEHINHLMSFIIG